MYVNQAQGVAKPKGKSKAEKPFRPGKGKYGYVQYYSWCRFCGNNGHTIHNCKKKQAYDNRPYVSSYDESPKNFQKRPQNPHQRHHNHSQQPQNNGQRLPNNHGNNVHHQNQHARLKRNNRNSNNDESFDTAPIKYTALNKDGSRSNWNPGTNQPSKAELRWVPKV